MEKFFIKNRHNQKIAVIVDEGNAGLVFVMHGLGGFKEQKHIEAIASAFQGSNYTVVRFDTTNSIGESEGEFEKATVGNYYDDLVDVIEWAKTQSWYVEPFVLAGHGLGGMCVTLYAEANPDKVKGIAPIATLVSGKLCLEAEKDKIEDWQKTGWRFEESKSKPGITKRLPWSAMEDRQKYDILEKADKLTMPVLLIVGERDDSSLPAHQQIFYDALLGPREIYIINNAEHNFWKVGERQELMNNLGDWIDRLDK